MNQRKRILYLSLVLLSTGLFAQPGLRIQGNVLELVRGDESTVNGIFSSPNISPNSHQLFSFVRQIEDDRYLHIYHTARSELTEVQPTLAETDTELGNELSSGTSIVFNDELDWRPVYDERGWQWYVFVSNAGTDNHDLYLGTTDADIVIRLTFDEAIDNSPKWSPDGLSIAFTSARSGNGDIYLITEMDEILRSHGSDEIRVERLTDSPQEELSPNWNPNPLAQLLAYTKRVLFTLPKGEAFQIRVIDVNSPDNNIEVTNDPTVHYTRPAWNYFDDRLLAFVGQSAIDQTPASVQISEFEWSGNSLEHRRLEGIRGAVYHSIRLDGVPPLWVAGGSALLCQDNSSRQQYPLFSVNIDRWQSGRGSATSHLESLHNEYPGITGMDLLNDLCVFTVQKGKHFGVYATRLSGDDIEPFMTPVRMLSNPNQNQPFFMNRYVQVGSAGAVGALIWLVASGGDEIDGDDGDNDTRIGLPPAMPDNN